MEFNEQPNDDRPPIPYIPPDLSEEVVIGNENSEPEPDGRIEDIPTDGIGVDPELDGDTDPEDGMTHYTFASVSDFFDFVERKAAEATAEEAAAVKPAATDDTHKAAEASPEPATETDNRAADEARAEHEEHTPTPRTPDVIATVGITAAGRSAYAEATASDRPDTIATALGNTPAATEARGKLIRSDAGGAVKLYDLGDGHFALDTNIKNSFVTREGVTELTWSTRVVMDGAGNIIESGDAVEEPSIMDYRQPFGEAYERPEAADQQVAGKLLQGACAVLRSEFPTDPPVFDGLEVHTVRRDDIIVSTRSLTPQKAAEMGHDIAFIYIAEQTPSGTGKYSEYSLTREGSAIRKDAHGVNNASYRKGLIDTLRFNLARSQGKAAALRVLAEQQARDRHVYDKEYAVARNLNFLPISSDEMRIVIRLVGDKLGIADRLQHLLEEPEEA